LPYRPLAPGREPADPARLAAALLSRVRKAGGPAAVPDPEPELDLDWGDGPQPPTEPAETLAVVARRARLLNPFEQRLLANAIDEGEPVEIGYLDAHGQHTRRVIEAMMLDGPGVAAWCRLREDDRMFLLDRIDSVNPA
ncbi:MAG: hypothetical protein J2P15_14385, partial [Micromonosporaceae bacterium]|nr:hypothetical protein [Micromonosporaceae bacterium]